MKKAFVIGHITVKDNAKWCEYRNKVPATLEPLGAVGRLAITSTPGEIDISRVQGQGH